MSDQIQLSPGSAPWLPSPDTEPIETLSYYDGPLLGLIRQHGVPYLFRCLGGELGSAQIWLYVTLAERDSDALQNSAGESLDELIESLSSTTATVALADDKSGLLYWETQDLSGVPAPDLPLITARHLRESIERISVRSADLAKII